MTKTERLDEFLTCAAMVIDHFGWVTKQEVKLHPLTKIPTSTIVARMLQAPDSLTGDFRKAYDYYYKEHLEMWDGHKDTADAALRWATRAFAISAKSGRFESVVMDIINRGVVEQWQMGYATTIVGKYLQNLSSSKFSEQMRMEWSKRMFINDRSYEDGRS
jgi:hypothetical protein